MRWATRACSAAASSNSSYRPGATNLRGLATYVRLAKDGGDFNWEAQANVRTPGFEVNDISFLSRADYAQFVGNVGYNWTKPTRWYRDRRSSAARSRRRTSTAT